MKKSFLILSCLAFSILTSCNNTTTETEESTTTDSITSPTPDTMAFQEQMPGEITTTMAPATADGPAPADGLNPAHGMPGHRCDINVGEPLSSAPRNAPQTITASPSDNSGIQGATTIQVPPPSTAPAASQPVPSSEKSLGTPMVGGPSSVPTTTAPGMNPPHGQPGHDCGVAVGAPLKK